MIDGDIFCCEMCFWFLGLDFVSYSHVGDLSQNYKLITELKCNPYCNTWLSMFQQLITFTRLNMTYLKEKLFEFWHQR